MQIISNGDNLHEMPDPVFWKKNTKNFHQASAEFANRVVKVKNSFIYSSMAEKYTWNIGMLT